MIGNLMKDESVTTCLIHLCSIIFRAILLRILETQT